MVDVDLPPAPGLSIPIEAAAVDVNGVSIAGAAPHAPHPPPAALVAAPPPAAPVAGAPPAAANAPPHAPPPPPPPPPPSITLMSHLYKIEAASPFSSVPLTGNAFTLPPRGSARSIAEVVYHSARLATLRLDAHLKTETINVTRLIVAATLVDFSDVLRQELEAQHHRSKAAEQRKFGNLVVYCARAASYLVWRGHDTRAMPLDDALGAIADDAQENSFQSRVIQYLLFNGGCCV
jgi:hypothetical protein